MKAAYVADPSPSDRSLASSHSGQVGSQEVRCCLQRRRGGVTMACVRRGLCPAAVGVSAKNSGRRGWRVVDGIWRVQGARKKEPRFPGGYESCGEASGSVPLVESLGGVASCSPPLAQRNSGLVRRGDNLELEL